MKIITLESLMIHMDVCPMLSEHKICIPTVHNTVTK